MGISDVIIDIWRSTPLLESILEWYAWLFRLVLYFAVRYGQLRYYGGTYRATYGALYRPVYRLAALKPFVS
jgi:hypothetical protein